MFRNMQSSRQHSVDTAALVEQGRALIDGERDAVANAANLAALLYASRAALNWVGFYFLKGDELVLGPFQGKPACTRIALNSCVCGRAAAERRTLVVPNVCAFPGHIACDPASRSEIVVPLLDGGDVFGVLDADSPIENHFEEDDRLLFEAIARLFVAGSDFRAGR